MKTVDGKLICFLVFVGFKMPSFNGRPLPKQIVDMTYTFDETTQHWPGNRAFKLDVVFNGSFLGDRWFQTEEYSSAIHVGTHLDAPAHASKCGMTVEQIPMSSLVAEAAVVDITTRAESNPDAQVTVEDLLDWESSTGQDLNGKILLLRTGWGRKWGNTTAFHGSIHADNTTLHSPGLSGVAADWLVSDRNIVGVGSETLSVDAGISLEFPAHLALLGHGVYVLENVANMDRLPVSGATLYVMPMKIGRASGAPARIFATFPHFSDNNSLEMTYIH